MLCDQTQPDVNIVTSILQGSVRSSVPLAVVGSGRGGDCAPRDANYSGFYEACSAPAVELVLADAGHFQFLDEQSTLDRAVCTVGRTPDTVIKLTSQALMVAWGQLMIRERKNASFVEVADRVFDLKGQVGKLLAGQNGDIEGDANKVFQLRSKGLEGRM